MQIKSSSLHLAHRIKKVFDVMEMQKLNKYFIVWLRLCSRKLKSSGMYKKEAILLSPPVGQAHEIISPIAFANSFNTENKLVANESMELSNKFTNTKGSDIKKDEAQIRYVEKIEEENIVLNRRRYDIECAALQKEENYQMQIEVRPLYRITCPKFSRRGSYKYMLFLLRGSIIKTLALWNNCSRYNTA